MSKRKKNIPVYVFDIDLFQCHVAKRGAAVALYEALTYLVADPPNHLVEDPEKTKGWPEEYFIVAAYPECARFDLVRDLCILLGEGESTVTKRLILLGANNPKDMKASQIDRFMYDRIKERGFLPHTYVTANREEDLIERKIYPNILSLS
jgi:hypothetical protein